MSPTRPRRGQLVYILTATERRFGFPHNKTGHRWLCVHADDDSSSSTILLCYTSSMKNMKGRIKYKQPTDVVLNRRDVIYIPGAENSTGKHVDSYIRCNTIYSVEPSGIGPAFARVPPAVMHQVDEALRIALGLPTL